MVDKVKGVPVLFVPGNAGSYKQVRSYASEAAYYYYNAYRHNADPVAASKRPLDFFSVDFNEDITAFHGQTLLDQAEYLNDAISFILSLYHSPSRSLRDSDLPDPTAVIIVGHSMGGVVARTMLTMPNYQSDFINTIITLAAPHARPPASFDGDIVRTYKGVNDYWRHAYSQKWATDNPLRHVTLISIAGGGLDTIISSDYANTASLVPSTHGFTVFTSSMPHVWTGMDHQAITWCDQARKSVVHALYDTIDVSRPMQTVPRADRMRIFKKWFLTGLEDISEKTLPQQGLGTLLTLAESSTILPQGQKLVIQSLGQSAQRPKAYLLPVPPQAPGNRKRFTFLSSERLDAPGEHGKIEVLFCSVFPIQAGQSATLFQMNMDLSEDSSGSTRLACKNAASDVVVLPASTRSSAHPFKSDQLPFSYLQYDLEDISEHQFVAIVDKAGEHTSGWVVVEFSSAAQSEYRVDLGLKRLLTGGLSLSLPAGRPLVTNIKISALQSSLLAYKIQAIARSSDKGKLFTTLMRQSVSGIHESKYFVNMKEADINIYGVAPYIPPPYFSTQPANGLTLQLWSDPTCQSDIEITLKVDFLGSLGKLWMRYRIVFAVFPLLVVSLVLRHQFTVYDNTGIFVSFSEALNDCIRTSLPFIFAALTLLSVFLTEPNIPASSIVSKGTRNSFGDTNYELLLGTEDAFFWFLIPLFGIMCVGICVVINYATLGIIHLLALLYSLFSSAALQTEDGGRIPTAFTVSSSTQRIITTCILISLVSTVIPYHFAYAVLCAVQLVTCVRGLKLARELVRHYILFSGRYDANRAQRLDKNYNFSNYTHSIFILMLWILPINLPVLVVWIRNLAVHWLTPFSSHHNILAIMPFVFLVETLSIGRMVPRVQSHFRFVTNALLFSIAAYAAVYGVSYAYVLPYLANVLCAWLVAVHFDVSSFSVARLNAVLDAIDPDSDTKKRP